MNANRFCSTAQGFLPALLFLAGVVTAAPAHAVVDGVAPAMAHVKEIMLQDIRVSNSPSYKKCSVNTLELSSALLKFLKGFGTPAFSVLQSKPPQIGVARIELVPEILTNNVDGMLCTSWVSLTAQTQNTLLVPPVDIARNVVITYWRAGLLVNSNETGHGAVLKDAFEKLSRIFSAQYNRDQPPKIKLLDENETENQDGETAPTEPSQVQGGKHP